MRSVADFLLELLTEEIPARMQAKAADDLGRLFAEAMAARGLAVTPETHVTPRRLALIAHGLPAATQPTREERRGPRADAPEGAIAGFLKSAGVERAALEPRDDPKGRFLYAVIDKPGRPLADVLAEAVPETVAKLAWPKSMRWGAASTSMDSPRWVRPLSGVVALLGEAIVPMTILGHASGRSTQGHRFMSSGALEIASPATYEAQLRAAHVILNAAERRQIIENGARAAAASAGLVLIEDPGLVAENAGLTEWPVPLLGRFDPAFLDVPREAIQLTMRVNQKYFACADAGGALAPAFVCVANIAAADGGAGIVEGNRRVLAARLSDARFFWEQDRAKPLADYLPGLDRVVFHEKLGTMRDKAERVAKLARWLVTSGAVNPQPVIPGLTRDPPASVGNVRVGGTEADGFRLEGRDDDVEALATLAERAGLLAKADLVTAMVGEFPELQGIMGSYYATASGEPPEVAAAIRDHYRPVGPGDFVPTEPVSVAVALADKLDTVFAFFLVHEFPTGSKDPYALRRAALGFISLCLNSYIRVQLLDAIAFLEEEWTLWCQIIFGTLGNMVLNQQAAEEEVGSVAKSLTSQQAGKWVLPREIRVNVTSIDMSKERDRLDAASAIFQSLENIPRHALIIFFMDRLKVQQREAGVRHDLIDAVFALGNEDDLVRLLARVHALQAFIGTPDGTNLLAAYKRAANILAIEAKRDGVERFEAPLPADHTLAAALTRVTRESTAAIAAEDFTQAMAALARLRAPIDAFFTATMVNDPDPAIRHANLALLQRFTDAVHAVADFSRIEG